MLSTQQKTANLSGWGDRIAQRVQRTDAQPVTVMEEATYISIWPEHSNSTACAYFGFAIGNDLNQAESTCTISLDDLTAEEVGQLLGGS